MRLSVLLLSTCLVLFGCSSEGVGDQAACGGILLSAPEENGETGSGSFTIAELMAHSAAMGMTQQEAETLLYLEGISPSKKLSPGETLCVDGTPG